MNVRKMGIPPISLVGNPKFKLFYFVECSAIVGQSFGKSFIAAPLIRLRCTSPIENNSLDSGKYTSQGMARLAAT